MNQMNGIIGLNDYIENTFDVTVTLLDISISGASCDRTCSSGHYGIHCMAVCQCLNNGTCDHVTGVCACADGYTGDDCGTPCGGKLVYSS